MALVVKVSQLVVEDQLVVDLHHAVARVSTQTAAVHDCWIGHAGLHRHVDSSVYHLSGAIKSKTFSVVAPSQLRVRVTQILRLSQVDETSSYFILFHCLFDDHLESLDDTCLLLRRLFLGVDKFSEMCVLLLDESDLVSQLLVVFLEASK